MEDFFNKYGISLASNEAEIGKTYPIFGIITDVQLKNNDDIFVEINYSIQAKMNFKDLSKLETLKARAFEPAIFISTVLNKEGSETLVDCQTVIFGKKPEYSA